MPKILHLSTNNKFISYSVDIFESAFPEQNDFLIINLGIERHSVNAKYDCANLLQVINPLFYLHLKKYDIVILHSLSPVFVTIVNRAHLGIKFSWIGWGFDYYDIIFDSELDMLIGRAREYAHKEQSDLGFFPSIGSGFKTFFRKLIFSEDKDKAIARLSTFSPVLPQEIDLIKPAEREKFPPCMPWNYGVLDVMIGKAFIGQKVVGNNILIGNSASILNNHFDAFNTIYTCGVSDRKICVPLSYGVDNDFYVESVIQDGNRIFNEDFLPMITFMPIDEYIDTVSSCGFVVMNHVRQQGLGNIILMMYLGAKIFLREECPTYSFFKNNGAIIYTTRELELNPSLLDHRLNENEAKINIEIIYNQFSTKTLSDRTKTLVNFVIRNE